MSLLTPLRLWLIYHLTSWLETRDPVASWVETDPDDPHELTDAEWAALVEANPGLGMPADCLPRTWTPGDSPILPPAPESAYGPDAEDIAPLTDVESARIWQGIQDGIAADRAADETESRQADVLLDCEMAAGTYVGEMANERPAYLPHTYRWADGTPVTAGLAHKALAQTDPGTCSLLSGTDSCRRCKPHLCEHAPGERQLSDADRADIALDAEHVRREDGAGEV